MRKAVWLAAFCAMAISKPANADETGLAGMHDWRKEGARTCLSGHFHDGTGKGQNRKAAEARAVASWSSFTVLEYGTTWGSYALAANKKMDCTQNGASLWSCEVSARPCKTAERIVAPAKRAPARTASSPRKQPAAASGLTFAGR